MGARCAMAAKAAAMAGIDGYGSRGSRLYARAQAAWPTHARTARRRPSHAEVDHAAVGRDVSLSRLPGGETLRLAFRCGTVPAVSRDGKRNRGSRHRAQGRDLKATGEHG